MSKIRAFIAAKLPEVVLDELASVSNSIAENIPYRSVRWVKPGHMHLTLRFLGDTERSVVPIISENLDRLVEGYDPIELRLSGFGCFPNMKRPRVLWVGLDNIPVELVELKQHLDIRLAPIGWEPETRRFKPHLTIGRVRDTRLLKNISLKADVAGLLFSISALYLIESELTSSGPIYSTRHISRFGYQKPEIENSHKS